MMTTKTVTLDEMKAAVIKVYNELNGNIPVKFIVRATQEELYGRSIIEKYPELKKASGAYLPNGDHVGRNRGQSFMYFGSSAILYHPREPRFNERGHETSQGQREAERVVRHEVLGHYALNTLTRKEKLNVLNTIINRKDDPTLQDVWNKVEKLYPLESKLGQAEEVYSFTAENGIILDKNYIRSQEKFSLKDLEQLTAAIGEGIKTGQRVQQIFPQNNRAQFRKKSDSLLETRYQWSAADQKMHLTINGQVPSKIDIDLLKKISAQDRFLRSYTIEEVGSGKLDLSKSNAQPVPKTFTDEGLPLQDMQTKTTNQTQ
jgi:hypothetical protein